MSASSHHPGLNLATDDKAAQAHSEKVVFGFWVFMMSDLIVFGLLFATYATMSNAQAGGPGPDSLFDLGSVAAQTMLLLASSYTYGLASLSLKDEAPAWTISGWILLTALLGAGFLTLELRDFTHLIAQGGVPQRSGWLSALWALVGLHGLHITIGLLWIGAMLAQIMVLGLQGPVKTRLLLLGIYWHFLGLLWIGILSIVYLGGML